mgnify:CR=1 FL=1
MGAIGWSQFLPSNVPRYGADGDGDGKIDLFQPDDAIFSVANYLRAFGWRPTASRAEKEKAVHRYNHSTPYVDAVLTLAAMLPPSATPAQAP